MTSINKIKKYRGNDWLIFNEALIVLKDTEIPSDVKSAYLDLVESVYIEPSIDRNGRCIDDLWHCYVSSLVTFELDMFKCFTSYVIIMSYWFLCLVDFACQVDRS